MRTEHKYNIGDRVITTHGDYSEMKRIAVDTGKNEFPGTIVHLVEGGYDITPDNGVLSIRSAMFFHNEVLRLESDDGTPVGAGASFYKVFKVKHGEMLSRHASGKDYGPQLKYKPGEVTAAAAGSLGIFGFTTALAARESEYGGSTFDPKSGYGYTCEVWECVGLGKMPTQFANSPIRNGVNYRAAIPVKKVYPEPEPPKPKFQKYQGIHVKDGPMKGMYATVTQVHEDDGTLSITVPYRVRMEEVE